MRLKFGKKTMKRTVARLKNKARVRKKIEGTAERPRLAVYRSNSNVYAQLIDDEARKVLVASSSLKMSLKNKSNVEAAKAVGAEIAKKAQEKSISSVVFDRSGYVYHGRVKAVADSARESGLKF